MGRHTKPHRPDDEGPHQPPPTAQHRPGVPSTPAPLPAPPPAQAPPPAPPRAQAPPPVQGPPPAQPRPPAAAPTPAPTPAPAPASPPVPPPAAGRPPVSLDVTMPDVNAFYKTRGPEPGPATDLPSAPARPPATGRPGVAAPVAGAETGAPRPPGRGSGKKKSDDDGAASGFRWSKKLVIAPLLPITALVIAVGIVAYAGSTSQISLNFGGGTHETVERGGDGAEVTEREPNGRASRGAGKQGLVVAFRLASRTETGFRGTVTIANRGRQPVADWAIAFRIPNVTFVSATGGTVVRTGQTLYVRRAPTAAALAPGQRVQIAYAANGVAQGPSVCRINKAPCLLV